MSRGKDWVRAVEVQRERGEGRMTVVLGGSVSVLGSPILVVIPPTVRFECDLPLCK